MTEPTDTPVHSPPSKAEVVKAFIGDLARPFVLYALGVSSSAAIIIAALRVENGNDGAILIGAAGLIVGGAYGFKSFENSQASKHAASVEIAKAANPANSEQL